MSYQEDYEAVRRGCTVADQLTQLAEECAELVQAALKLRRAIGNTTSPTPTSEAAARAALIEEAADVLVCLDVVLEAREMAALDRTLTRKLGRWHERLEAAQTSHFTERFAEAGRAEDAEDNGCEMCRIE